VEDAAQQRHFTLEALIFSAQSQLQGEGRTVLLSGEHGVVDGA
jgi:hypothetical protein